MADSERKTLEIAGGRPLIGEITVQGSKNAALPILAASLLGDGPCVIENCPRIQDVEDTLTLLHQLGCQTSRNGSTVTVNASEAGGASICCPEASRIRSSVLFLGALLGKMGKAVLPYPGGCAIGRRPIDLHLDALRVLGVRFYDTASKKNALACDGSADMTLVNAAACDGTADKASEKASACDGTADMTSGKASACSENGAALPGRIIAEASRLRGGTIRLAMPSVGATENSILAAVCAEGETRIENAALEPEVEELCAFLRLRGAEIMRNADGSIRIWGKRFLTPARYRLGADRVVAGSYLLAVAACGGCVRFHNLPSDQLRVPIEVFRFMGGTVEEDGTACVNARLRAVPYLETAAYPGFPTDLQSPLMAALCMAQGVSRIRERIFENRLNTAAQLNRMGARIATEGALARIEGPARLVGTDVRAPDLRGGAALAAAGLAACGRTVIDGYEYIARGYEDICRDFGRLGADIHLR
ncbi:MAG: UDP-N-acetylglucosamine 1-carboxyvinyltransferase [Lachnospiraceae bacterium]|nr:UDP-N-acetylglucosamine 1-carboxyvinyltransferase [Lachnospiraceae bacterium]